MGPVIIFRISYRTTERARRLLIPSQKRCPSQLLELVSCGAVANPGRSGTSVHIGK